MKKAEKIIKETEKFLKEAFCIDGICKCKSIDKLISDDKTYEAVTYELKDSKRGTFYISMSKPSTEISN